jgi:crotonobetainyl-CoA:carnitine CoA-transferase CaiB-like acyl-CoA transferase
MRAERKGPLAGIRVVESASFITGPYCGQLLADLGADVIKVEAPDGGDPFRSFAGSLYSPHFIAFNRNKRSLTLDLRTDRGKLVMRRLLEGADVFLENYRPGVVERLGLDYPTVRAWNPRVIYCSISGMGQSGPYVHRPTYDTIGQALSGMLSQLLEKDHPRIVGPAFSDGITGLTAAYLVLAALAARERTGKGQKVEVSMLEATTAFQSSETSFYFQSGDAGGPRRRASMSQSYAFTCQDGALVAIHLSSPQKFWEGLVRSVDRPDLLEDERFATRLGRATRYEQLHALLAEEFKKKPCAEWLKLLEANDVPHAPVYRFDEVFADPQARHLGLELRLTHPTQGEIGTAAPPGRFSATPWGNLLPPPALGEHTEEILRELDLPDERPSGGEDPPPPPPR